MRTLLKRLGPMELITKLFHRGWTARDVFRSFGLDPPSMSEDDPMMTPVLLLALTKESRRRLRLPHVSSIDDVVKLLQSSKNILVITGAGISTSLGIPDFRSSDGIYSRLAKYNLSDPQEMFDIDLFTQDPSIFFDFCKELLPEDRGYSPTHAFIRLLQDKGKLLTQYTQNIDDIESSAGVDDQHLIQCHGSFKRATCLTCGRNRPGSDLFPEILAGNVPRCEICLSNLIPRAYPKKKASSWDNDASEEEDMSDPSFAVLKPDITFFGEQLPTAFKDRFLEDRSKVDLTLCIGTSLRVAPVANIPEMLDPQIPQILISRDKLHGGFAFDVEFLDGACDAVCLELAYRAGWSDELDKLIEAGSVPGRVKAERAGDRLEQVSDHIYTCISA
ncbi:DHS-like NAD/FAD-binding domain-containing protein [Protomyces lactucae-debilis]|uniref:DHS-like NAD/FAD-binding domain-containing protein n=1 Tax=Protomyces lactucae-debilis TaxID=2754530 RepID=A0A1Y2F2Q0_PROLT|nr:DHS-like NAD/FAD-binding domain-containing protein [Protomyces lactucae-debilis]ORY78151.1 DHS-like NAD/FAD-binding domain-containing protein [Protomyces lactucae-debilis]